MESDEIPSANDVPTVESSVSPDHGVSDIQPLAPSDDAHCDHDRDHDQDHHLDQQEVVEPDHEDDHGNDQPSGSEDLSGDLLKKKIIKQVEYYFSDENLLTDKYMMALIKKDKDGFIPIPIIASFRKMKKLTKDDVLIVAALRQSTFLVVSSSGKKVRRLHPLPSTEVKDPKLCTVLVENLPEDHSEENIRKIFVAVGSIKKIRIHDPHLVEKSAKGSKVDPLIRHKLHALVEYETVDAAEKAAATLNHEEDWRNGMRVKLLKKLGQYGQRRQVWKGPDSEKSSAGRSSDRGEEEDIHNLSEHHDDTPDEEEGDRRNGQRGRNRGQSRRQKYQGITGRGHGSGTTYSSHTSEVPKPPPGPKMPDGTRGFTMGRGRPPLSNQS